MENNIKKVLKSKTLSGIIKLKVPSSFITELINTYYEILKSLLNNSYFRNLETWVDDAHPGWEEKNIGWKRLPNSQLKPIRGEKYKILEKVHYVDSRGFIYFTRINTENNVNVEIDVDLILETTGFSNFKDVSQYGMYDKLLDIFKFWVENNYNIDVDLISFQEGINDVFEPPKNPLPPSIMKNFEYKTSSHLNESQVNIKKILKITETDLIKIVKKVIIERTNKHNLDKKIIYYINRYASETPKEPDDDIFKWSFKILKKLSDRFENENENFDINIIREKYDEYIFKLYGASQSEIDEILKYKRAGKTIEKMRLSGANQSEIDNFIRNLF
jgi:hypothetical protein